MGDIAGFKKVFQQYFHSEIIFIAYLAFPAASHVLTATRPRLVITYQ